MKALKILSTVLLGTALLGVSAGAFADRGHRAQARHIERDMDRKNDLPSPAFEVHHRVSQGVKYGQEGVQDATRNLREVAQ